MKKYFLLVILCIGVIFTGCAKDKGHPLYEEEYDYQDLVDEYNKGYDNGHDDGVSFGEEEGYYDGLDDGYSEGYDAGYSDGYSDGCSDGYYEGATYTCLYFGDVDLAFRSAKNGCAWRTFICAYDEFVENIYDTDEEESALFWAFIGMEDASPEEIELLISTFGEDIFEKNDIVFKNKE